MSNTSEFHGPEEQLFDEAVWLAGSLAADAAQRSTSRRQRRAARLIRSRAAVSFLEALTDEVMRIPDPRRSARRFRSIVATRFPPDGLGSTDAFLLRVGAGLAQHAPRLVMALVTARLRTASADLVIDAERRLGPHLRNIERVGMRGNVNALGEAILGPAEAEARLLSILGLIERDDVTYVSVKLSAIVDNLSALAFERSVSRAAERLRVMLRAAITNTVFVNLDMEEYRDLSLTTTAFTAVLDEAEFARVEAGIVLQAYLPDSARAAAELGAWAVRRVERGGVPIKVRVVKGANLAMERVEAELRGWEQAPFATKHAVDANYKHLLDVLLAERFDAAVRVGLASHNLFDVAWGLLLKRELAPRDCEGRLEFEMLQGMAPAQAQALVKHAGSVLLYTPVVGHADFTAAIAYLVRRLDENSDAENFLAHVSTIATDQAEFHAQAERFRRAARERSSIDSTPRRQQDRSRAASGVPVDVPFANEPDTDFSLAANRRWLAGEMDVHAKGKPNSASATIVTDDDVDLAVAMAIDAQPAWGARPTGDRASIINAIGDTISAHRGEILAAMAHTAGKTIAEGDPEISEAIDFARYYGREALRLEAFHDATTTSEPIGPVVIAPPWNFPYAIALGGVAAALAAGNTVLLKPAPQAEAVQRLVAEHCWAAGVPQRVLQFLPAPDGAVGRHLIEHPAIAAVVLTGAYDTARLFHSWRPQLRLFAETSGKNAMVISATADVDLALKDLTRSAFGHAGQKCSAASLAIVEAALYDDPRFRARLADAVRSLRCGPPDDPATDVAPLIGAPSSALERALTVLDPGEEWLVQPQPLDTDRRHWSPGVRIGVRRDSWFASTECFGPVLGVLRAESLDEAITMQNDSPFGLTAGLHALDPAEIDRWTDAVEAGNLYVNRSMTGAIVRRQPFGGWKRSRVGATSKAGGPLYVAQFRAWTSEGFDADAVAESYAQWWAAIGCQDSDPTGLRAESNRYRLRPLPGPVMVRIGSQAPSEWTAIARAAAKVTGVEIVESCEDAETEAECLARMQGLRPTHLRLLGKAGPDIWRGAHELETVVDDRPPVTCAALELPRWTHEQVVSVTMHRHGHIDESRLARDRRALA